MTISQSRNDALTPEPKDSPLMKAWEAFKASSEYANARKWALHEEHVDGSLWHAFSMGFMHTHHNQAPFAVSERTENAAPQVQNVSGTLAVSQPDTPAVAAPSTLATEEKDHV